MRSQYCSCRISTNLLCILLICIFFVSKTDATTNNSKESNPKIRIGVIQHFGKDDSQNINIQSSKKGEKLELIFPRSPRSQDLNDFQRQLLSKIEINTNYLPLQQNQVETTKVIAGTYRTYETASYWADLLRQSLPNYEWITLYSDPWEVVTYSPTPMKTMSELNGRSYKASWIKEVKSRDRVLQWEASSLIGEKLNPQIHFKFNRSRLLVRSPSNRPIKVNNRLYPGTIEVIPDSFGTFSVVNEVKLEDYLRGVVPYEVGHDAPKSALETQAILARTYTMANLNRFTPENYNLCASQHCQVYRGIGAASPTIDQAIRNTSGLVLKNTNGSIAQIYYYSTDGGFSADYTDVWPSINLNQVKHLSGVSTCSKLPKKFDLSIESDARLFLTDENAKNWGCYDSVSPAFRWEKNYSLSQLTDKMKEAQERWKFSWPEFDKVKNILVNKRNRTGRVTEILVITDEGEFTVELDEIRAALGGLRSTFFVILRDENNLKIKGGGYGHSVGLSQYGARNLAAKGKSYQDILSLYFPYFKIDRL
ncbi:MAG: SpoIID/LytB domain-containing protein [Candidatus Caenarcaniphilales bacterium]|nr:SpoIID/LytB domain-containing protein [Candidatus Caenarcaniphilales bacterium]